MPDTPCVLSLGSINADFQVRVDRRPEPGETLIGRDFVQLSGGKAANVAYLARRLGVPSRLIGRVGADALAEQALAPLRAAGIDVEGVSASETCPTGVSMIATPPDGRKGITLAQNANMDWSEEAREAAIAAIEAAPDGAVLVLDCEIPPALALRAAKIAKARGMCRVLDPSPAAAVGEALLACVDVLVPNPVEAEHLTGITIDGEDSAVEAARALAAKGPGAICMKLPEGGCVLLHDGNLHRIGGPKSDPVDTNGAGDAFAGALAAALAQGHDMLRAACHGVAAADVAVGGYGAQPSYPDARALEARLNEITASRIDRDPS